MNRPTTNRLIALLDTYAEAKWRAGTAGVWSDAATNEARAQLISALRELEDAAAPTQVLTDEWIDAKMRWCTGYGGTNQGAFASYRLLARAVERELLSAATVAQLVSNTEMLEALKAAVQQLELLGGSRRSEPREGQDEIHAAVLEQCDAAIARAAGALIADHGAAATAAQPLPVLRSGFRTTVQVGGEKPRYMMVFEFATSDDMHRADDEWRAWRAAAPAAQPDECATCGGLGLAPNGLYMGHCSACGGSGDTTAAQPAQQWIPVAEWEAVECQPVQGRVERPIFDGDRIWHVWGVATVWAQRLRSGAIVWKESNGDKKVCSPTHIAPLPAAPAAGATGEQQ